MFRHKGKTRTFSHNLKIASVLSFVAGLVNVAGFLSVQRLTTNVTGHFAFFVDEVFKLNISGSLVFFLYILLFLAGSFVSNLLIEITSRRNERYIYIIPALLELLILVLIGIYGDALAPGHPDMIAYALLFSMGLQNALVTRISDALVRTTHLTGLFTDLGIELSQLFFYRTVEQKARLLLNIRLRARIIVFFFTGGVVGGVFYGYLTLKVLLIAATVLILGLVYDHLRYKILVWNRRNLVKSDD